MDAGENDNRAKAMRPGPHPPPKPAPRRPGRPLAGLSRLPGTRAPLPPSAALRASIRRDQLGEFSIFVTSGDGRRAQLLASGFDSKAEARAAMAELIEELRQEASR
jgi:hypothetical protein